MGWLADSLTASIGKKFIMALTGIFLILFLIVHLAGNLFLFVNDGGESFNTYSATLRKLPIVFALEAGLGILFLIHIIYAGMLWLENRRAKGGKYAVNAASKNSDIFSRLTVVTGSIIFIFLVIHLRTFWYGHVIEGHEGTLYDLVVKSFSDPIYSGFYILAMILLGIHLNHSFQSAFQTFGWNHKKYFPFIKGVGTLYSIIMAAGFASMPIYFLFFYGGNL